MLESEMPHGAGSEAIGLVNRRSSTRGHQRQLLARRGPNGSGRACLLCPGSSDVNLFRNGEGIIDLDTEVPDSAFDLCDRAGAAWLADYQYVGRSGLPWSVVVSGRRTGEGPGQCMHPTRRCAARVLSRRDASFRTTPAGELNIDALERSLPSKLA